MNAEDVMSVDLNICFDPCVLLRIGHHHLPSISFAIDSRDMRFCRRGEDSAGGFACQASFRRPLSDRRPQFSVDHDNKSRSFSTNESGLLIDKFLESRDGPAFIRRQSHFRFASNGAPR
jgi:hypothetical protein